MKCRQYESLLLPYLEGAFAAEERDRISRHLEECTACGEELASLSHTVSRLKATRLPVAEPSPHLWEAIRRQIEQPAPPFWHRYRLALAMPALAASLALAVLFSTGRPPQSPPAMMAQAPASQNLPLTAPPQARSSDSELTPIRKADGNREAAAAGPPPGSSYKKVKPQTAQTHKTQRHSPTIAQRDPSAGRDNREAKNPAVASGTQPPGGAAVGMKPPRRETGAPEQAKMTIARNPSLAEEPDHTGAPNGDSATMAMKAEAFSAGGGFGGAVEPTDNESIRLSAPEGMSGSDEERTMGAAGGLNPGGPPTAKNRGAGGLSASGVAADNPQEAMFQEKYKAEGRQALFRYP